MTVHAKTIDSLCALLEKGDEADRCYVVRTFGALRESSVLTALVKRLRDDDIDVCVDAVEALGRLDDPAVIPPLLESLRGDPSGEVRTAAVEALGRFNDPQVVKALVDVIERRPEDLELEGDWDDWWDMQRHAVVALGHLQAAEAVPTLVALLESEEGGDIEGETLQSLAQLGTLGVNALQRRLTEGPVRQRSRAAKALGHAADRATLPILAKGLLDEEPEVRIAVLEALGQRQAGRYLPAVLLALKDRSAEVRSKATEVALQMTGPNDEARDLVDPLLELLDDADSQVRRTALACLARLVATDASLALPEDALCRALADADPEVSLAACTLAGQVGGEALITDLLGLLGNVEGSPRLRREAALALGTAAAVTAPVVEGLQAGVGDPEQPVRLGALTGLMRLTRTDDGLQDDSGTPDPLAIIIAAVRDDPLVADTGEVAAAGEPSLEAIDDAAMPAVEATETTDDGPETVPEVNSTMAAIARDNVEAALLFADDDPEKTNRDPLVTAAETDDELRPFVEIVQGNLAQAEVSKRVRKPSVGEEIRRLGARMLADSGAPEGVSALIDVLLDGDTELSREAADALGRIARRNPGVAGLDNAFGVLVTLLGLGKHDQRVAAIRALAALGNIAALGPLVERLDDTDSVARGEAVKAVAELAARVDADAADDDQPSVDTVRDLIVSCLDDAEPGVRVAAANALVSLQVQVGVTETAAGEAIGHLIEAAFHGNGGQARAMGQALRAFDSEISSARLLQRLDELDTSQQRRFVLEMIEELHRPETTGQLQAA